MSLKQFLESNILLFDGAMGTYLSSNYNVNSNQPEILNITNAKLIQSIHQEYIESGANAIKTNTFNVFHEQYDKEIIITAAYQNALVASKNTNTYIFADIGYIPDDIENKLLAYQEIVNIFISLGAKYFIFESLVDDECLVEISHYIKTKNPDAFIISSFSIQGDGYTTKGQYYQNLYQNYKKNDLIDAFGFNCVSGPMHLKQLVKSMKIDHQIISIMPNASYPTVLGQRISYQTNPNYFSTQMLEIIDYGIKIIGGCCGTTPQFIKLLAHALQNYELPKLDDQKEKLKKQSIVIKNPFYEKLLSPKKAIAVELDAPLHDDVSKFMDNALYLKQSGADLITIADCPVGRPRMDSSLLACKLKQYQIQAMPHLTCRDRNINASKALLLGLSSEQISNLLVVTGDPIASNLRDEVKAVFQFNSRMFIQNIHNLNQTTFSSPFHIYAALNLNARNFSIQLKLALQKEANGAIGFFTQPIHSKQALDNLKLAKETLKSPIVVGILPIISYKNACFMNNEVPGIQVDQEIVDQYLDLTKEAASKLAIDLSKNFIDQAKDYCDGYYLITLFGRVDIIGKLIEYIEKLL